MSAKPVIAVTGPVHGGIVPWLMTWLAIHRAGGNAVRVHKENYNSALIFDGLVVGGGSDISPENYGAELMEIVREPSPRSFSLRLQDLVIFVLRLIFSIKLRQAPRDPGRDKLEKALITEALDKNLPVLGICRGEQMINVTLGGTLHQDTKEFYTEAPDTQSIRPVKTVTITSGSRLAAILETSQLRVNSLHTQAVDQLGTGLTVCARDRNNIVQAIEYPDRQFVIGVQWHPEYLPGQRTHQRLFHALVFNAKDVSSRR